MTAISGATHRHTHTQDTRSAILEPTAPRVFTPLGFEQALIDLEQFTALMASLGDDARPRPTPPLPSPPPRHRLRLRLASPRLGRLAASPPLPSPRLALPCLLTHTRAKEDQSEAHPYLTPT